jgi:hypothetical protein
MQKRLRRVTDNVLFDEEIVKECFPSVEVKVVWCTRSHWQCVWCALNLRKEYEQRVSQGRNARHVRFITLDGANHFVRPISRILVLILT